MSETQEQRSKTMQAVRSQDTRPEMIVRRFLHASGLRYRLHDRRLPGAPDLVFPSRRVALFVHGCFWHQHANCKAAKRPKSRTEYWNPKLDRNIERDRKQQLELESKGWNVIVIWECETKCMENLKALANRINEIPHVTLN